MNLMPSIPPGKRYFRLGLIIIILWLFNLALVVGWVWKEQSIATERLEKKVDKGKLQQADTRNRVHEYKNFMNEYGPTVRYRKSVEALDESTINWSDSLSILTEHLPKGATLFQAKADNDLLDGWAVFPTPETSINYLDELKKDSRVKEAYLDCFGSQCAEKFTLLKKAGTQIAHFHVTLQEETEGNDPLTASPVPIQNTGGKKSTTPPGKKTEKKERGEGKDHG
ncbi:hypothetical protein SAMN05444487_11752 [Marininema mesophilum]|uniref:Uncharacterized protein n=1 Tax=Marininema mesophilum TaxID=1048340 RepID=A0A1H3BLK1_9BACL|nr:hypothetical protein [Marininema mesophilum]SDX42843.1 hypothetical protein SAMN05444487_11752 [Marininema mesophilum]